MNNKLKEIFRGKVVNKEHTVNTGVDEFPRYVLEYLIDNYCSKISDAGRDGMEKTRDQIKKERAASRKEGRDLLEKAGIPKICQHCGINEKDFFKVCQGGGP